MSEEEIEYVPSFEGPCTCDHPADEHGWSECSAEDCPCEAGWVE